MATKANSKTNGCTFQWNIENISHCWLKTGERIASPTFIADGLESTKWSLWLYPLGMINEEDVDVYLHREKDCTGPNNFEVNCQASFLDKDGKFLKERTILKGLVGKDLKELCVWEKKEKVFVSEREAFLPEDTLTVQCTLWKKQEKPVKSKLFSSRTVFKVNRISFHWKIDEFSKLKPGVRNKIKDDMLDFELVIKEGLDFEKKLVINSILLDKRIRYFSFQIYIVDSEGKKEDCGRHEYSADDLKRGVLSTLLFSQKLTENKSRYLPNDVLSLDCECVYSAGFVSHEFSGCGIISPTITNVTVEKKSEQCIAKEKPQHTLDMAIDMEYMYNDGIFSDTELRTSTQTFPVHKNILSARSPVFRKMFGHDMKEKISGHVDITDLKDDTVHQMIRYIYTDSLYDLQIENAYKLYAAADKYEILSLRSRCSSFLKDNLRPNKACEVLVLADQHLDEDLKSAVQDYILKKDKEVFGLQEWEDFMDTNPKLAAKIMYRRCFQASIQ